MPSPSPFSRLRIRSHAGRIVVAEAFGIFVATVIIYSNFLQLVLAEADLSHSYFGFAFAVGNTIALGGYLSAVVAPLAPINPSVMVGMAVGGYLPVRDLPFYLLGEFVGALAGQFTVIGLYYDAISALGSQKPNGTAFKVPDTAFLCALPPPHASLSTQAMGVAVQLALLVCGVNCIMDRANARVPTPAQPVLFALLICIILTGFGHNAGGTMNAMMDLAGRIVSSCVGWGAEVWTYGDYFAWIPLVMGPLGAVVGALAYRIIIEPNLPLEGGEEEKTEAKETEKDEEEGIKVTSAL